MTISPNVTLDAKVSVTAGEALASGKFTIGLGQIQHTFSSADVAYAGVLEFTSSVEQFVVDIYQGLVTTPGSGSSRAASLGLNGKDADGNSIAMDTIYALIFQAPSTNTDTISIANVLDWTDGPLALEAGDASDLVDITPGSSVVLTNEAGWTISSGDELDFTVTHSADGSLQVLVIGEAA